MKFGVDRIGQWSDPRSFTVERARTVAYAAATNDPVDAHVNGLYAPPVFAVVPIWDTMIETMVGVVPEEALFTVVHGEQDIRIRRPIRPGETLVSRAAVMGVHAKPSGTTVSIKLETRDESDELVLEQWNVSFFRGVAADDSAGDQAPAHRFPEDRRADDPVAVVEQTLDSDQTFRYSEASGDTMPIHLDDAFARSVGLPGIIIHGLCTMAFTSWAAIDALANHDPARLARIAVRFSAPVRPGQTITTTFWAAGRGADGDAFVYETVNAEGEVVIKDGLVEIRP